MRYICIGLIPLPFFWRRVWDLHTLQRPVVEQMESMRKELLGYRTESMSSSCFWSVWARAVSYESASGQSQGRTEVFRIFLQLCTCRRGMSPVGDHAFLGAEDVAGSQTLKPDPRAKHGISYHATHLVGFRTAEDARVQCIYCVIECNV